MADENFLGTTEALAQAKVILAAISAATADEQVTLFRYHLERQVDQIEQLELGMLDFLNECVLLAGQNMQDVRLQLIEIRLDKLENPDPPSLKDITMDLVLVLAIELAVVASPYLAAGAVALLPVLMSRWKNFRLDRAAKALENLEKRWQDMGRRLNSEYNRYHEVFEIYMGKRTSYWITISSSKQELARSLEQIRKLNVERQKLKAQIEILRLAVNQKQVGKVINSYNPEIKPGKWRTFYEDAKNTTSGRIGEDLGAAFNEYVKRYGLEGSSGQDESIPYYLTSEATGGFLAEISNEKNRVLGEYSSLRLLARYLDDGLLLEDGVIQQFFIDTFYAISEGQSVLALKELLRPAIVAGFEFTCWVYYLARNGALASQDVEIFVEFSKENEIVGDVLVLDTVSPEDTQIFNPQGIGDVHRSVPVKGRQYPGIAMISDHMADYLYKKFARDIVSNSPYKIIPFEYEEADYQNVFTLPEDILIFFSNPIRKQRIAELKLIVILAFQHFLDSAKDIKTIPLFGVEARTIGEILPIRSGLNQPVPPSEAELEEAHLQALTALSSAVGQTDYAVLDYYNQYREHLITRLNDYFAGVTEYQLVRALNLEDRTYELMILSNLDDQKQAILRLIGQLQSTLANSSHDFLWRQIDTDFGSAITSIQNNDPENLLADEVKWSQFDSVIHPPD
jgi:hypothetical protein